MTFGARTFQGMQQSQVLSGSGNISDLRTTGTANASASLNADGSITYVGNGSGGPNWNSPVGGSPGASTWISWTVSGTGLGSGGSSSLAGGKNFSYSCPLNGSFVTGTITVKFFSDAGLTNQVGTITFGVDVESSNR